ncbi:hypothetical protein F4780DRAFT_536481 [Xylariomycetidae sp. FL0641]|nr:hypothetical protein F4780DRAFT_536481 [Xylariomycetidae sp. FL0641]
MDSASRSEAAAPRKQKTREKDSREKCPSEHGASRQRSATAQAGAYKNVTRSDRRMERYEEYLRNKWECSDALPEAFDPEKLEAKRKARSSKTKKSDEEERRGRSKTVSEPPKPTSTPALPVRKAAERKESEDDDDDDSGSAEVQDKPSDPPARSPDPARAPAASSASPPEAAAPPPPPPPKPALPNPARRFRSTSNPVPPTAPERAPTPRIRSGSKPPLSRSAFAPKCSHHEGGGAAAMCEGCRGLPTGKAAKREHAKYFAFRSRMGARR